MVTDNKLLPLWQKVELNYRLITKQPKISDIFDVFCLCAELTNEYDESHDLGHHADVFVNATNIYIQLIANDIPNEEVVTYITYAALLHDTIDYKYPNNLQNKIKKVDEYLKNKLGNVWLNVKWIIDNMSYSKEAKNGYPVHSNTDVQLARDIVSDADKLEAIGDIGIIRCTQYGRVAHPNANEKELKQLVIQHCHDKLLKIKDQYIRTVPGKLMAEPRHQVIADFVKNN